MSEEAETKQKPCCQKNKEKKLTKISDLPLYGNPYPSCDRIINQELGYIESGVKIVREQMSQYLSILNKTSTRAKQILTTAFEHSKSTYEYISSEANTVPKAVAITSGGFIGLLLASRKGFFKKITYTSIGLTAAAAACYPKQTNELAQLGIFIVKTKGPEIVKQYTGIDVNEKIGIKEKLKPQSKSIDTIGQEVKSEPSVAKSEPSASNTNTKPLVKGDFGMSKKEDEDLYANRSSK